MAIFAFDMDGTLYDHSTKRIPDSAMFALDNLKAQGHTVGVATGRNMRQLKKAVDPSFFDFLILVNGGYAEVNGKPLKTVAFSKEQKNRLCDYFDETNITYSVSTKEKLIAVNPNDKDLIRVINKYQVPTPDQLDNLRETDALQFCTYEKKELIYPKIKHFEGEFILHSLGDYGYDIVLPTIDKGTMFKEVAKFLGFNMKDSYAFGDSDNDAEFLSIAGTGVAMKNGTPKTISSADMVTTEVYNDGIYVGIQRLGFIKKDYSKISEL